jgi:hypothetical protein
LRIDEDAYQIRLRRPRFVTVHSITETNGPCNRKKPHDGGGFFLDLITRITQATTGCIDTNPYHN